MGGNNREFMLAIGLCAVVLLGWQLFYGIPQMQQDRAQQEVAQQAQTNPDGSTVPSPTQTQPSPSGNNAVPTPGGTGSGVVGTRETVIAATDRVAIETPKLSGSINLTGARLDDLQLLGFQETVDADSPTISLLSPSGTAAPYYAEFGWAPTPNEPVNLPNGEATWSAPAGATLTPDSSVTLTWDNGEGFIFTRTFSVDEDYLFTIRDEVENTSADTVTLHPYGLVSRHGKPTVLGYFVLHEGLVGVLGDELLEVDYDDLEDEDRIQSHTSTGGWLGITDKYWAVALLPDQSAALTARFSDNPRGDLNIYQADYLHEQGLQVPANGRVSAESRLFAGVKVVSLIDGYEASLGVGKFELLIDWGWFYFITKPLFWVLDYFYSLVGNFGLAILLVTVCIKFVFFPLANKSYASMSKMKLLQPEVVKLRERYKDDKQKQQQAMMELYKKEKVNPMSGCLPIVIQIPVFFALYKVLFGTIEMRHAPFVGWIQDLSAPDPTSIFNLFGLIPWDPPSFLMIGVWPLVMGITMFVQMRLNPPPPDPTQAMIFNWMPVFFTFLLATFPAGLIIYWAWNNLLSIAQQWVIMSRHGVKVELFSNIRQMFSFLKFLKKPKAEGES